MTRLRFLASVPLLLAVGCRSQPLQETQDVHGHRVFTEHVTKAPTPDIASLAFSRDGRLLVSLDSQGWMVVRDLVKGSFRRWQCHARKGVALALSPDGGQVATCGEDGKTSAQSLALWQLKDGALVCRKDTGQAYNELAFQTPQRLLACGWLTSVEAWDPVHGLRLQRFNHPGHDGHMRFLGITPAGVVHCRGERSTWVWQDGPGRPPLALDRRCNYRSVPILFGEEGPVRFNPQQGELSLETPAPRDISEWRPQGVLSTASQETSLQDNLFASDNLDWILGRGQSGTWYLWRNRQPEAVVLPAQPSMTHAVALDATRRRFAYGDRDARIILVKVP